MEGRPGLALVLVSGFGEQAEVTGTSFFVMRPFFHNAPTVFCNVPGFSLCAGVLQYFGGTLQKYGRITRICGA